ncbi:transposase [Streptomyces sp. NPDC059979]|uniref:IS110 family transposase n=1 Tax=Streptomyces sp. NPDC059979 TaxID=3347021 RepID=UPI003680465E
MSQPIEVIGGIDTHTDVHQAAVIDTIGRHLGTKGFPTTPAGYQDLLEWLHSHGRVLVVGMEGTGSFGAELGRHLRANQIAVVEVDRPDRRARRASGKSDSIDAYAAATAVLAGRATGTPKNRDGAVEAIRVLRVVRASAVKSRTQTINQIKSLIITAPGTRGTTLAGHPRTGPTAGRQPSRRRTRRPWHGRQNRPQAPGQAVPALERGDSGRGR